MAASIAAEPEGARMKGVILGAPDRRRSRRSSPRPSRTRCPPTRSPTSASRTCRARSARCSSRCRAPSATRSAASSRASPASSRSCWASPSTTSRRSPSRSTRWSSPPAATPGAALALEVEDGAAAQATLDKLRTGIPALVRTFSPDTTDPRVDPRAAGRRRRRAGACRCRPRPAWSTGWTATSPSSAPASRAVTSVQRPVAPLSGSAAYQAGTAGMPEQVTSVRVDQPPGLDRRAGQRRAPSTTPRRRRSPTCARSRASPPGRRPGETPTFEVFVRIQG